MATGGNEIDTSAAEAYEAFIVPAIFRPWAELERYPTRWKRFDGAKRSLG